MIPREGKQSLGTNQNKISDSGQEELLENPPGAFLEAADAFTKNITFQEK
jgi:hypothetical protein